jgi:hypothetical protein
MRETVIFYGEKNVKARMSTGALTLQSQDWVSQVTIITLSRDKNAFSLIMYMSPMHVKFGNMRLE